MNSCRRKVVLLAFLVLAASTLAWGQDWPKPAKTPNTDVPCTTSSCNSDPRHAGKKVIGYSGAITTFTGRFLDSSDTGTYFEEYGESTGFRVARAKMIRFAPEHGRVYIMIGSALGAYSIDTFFSRLEAGEQPVPASQYPFRGTTRSPVSENFLRFDRYFYGENQNGGGWPTIKSGDGPDRMFDFDWDDRKNVYIAGGPLGWGIVRDDGGTGGDRMPVSFHFGDPVRNSSDKNLSDEPDPIVILSVKTSGGKYYAIVAGSTQYMDVWDVTNTSAPKKTADLNRGGIYKYEKAQGGTRIALLNLSKGIEIYSNDALPVGGSPIAQFPGPYLEIATDGTNFYATSKGSGDEVILTAFTPTLGGSYVDLPPQKTSAKFSAGSSPFLGYGGGFLTVGTAERSFSGANNLHIFKVSNLQFTEVSINDYFAKYYSAGAPPGYTYPSYSFFWDAEVYKHGAKYYLLISNFGLGDVYEIKGVDAITAKILKKGKTPNEFSKGPSNGLFYGDEITFSSESNASLTPSVKWDFGDGTTTVAPPSAPNVSHQYGGLTAASLPVTRTVKAENAADAQITDTLSVTLAKPQVRVGVLGTSILFTEPINANALPIVSSDEFTDASDGAVEGHYNEWFRTGDTVATKAEPNQKIGVGAIGPRSLNFTAHYGPYAGAGPTLVGTSAADAQFSIGAIQYTVRPFAVGMSGPLACAQQNCAQQVANADGVGFRNATRVTTIASDLTGGSAAGVHYAWELLKPATGGGFESAGHSKSGDSTLSTVPDFIVPRTAFQNATGWKARLTLTLANAGNVADATYATGIAESGLLSGPGPGEIVQTGCATAGADCKFNTQVSGPIDTPWTYLWSATGPAIVQGSSLKEYSPKFIVPGTYTVSVKVSNALGDALPTPATVPVGASLCASNPTTSNTAIGYFGSTSSCFGPSTNCSVAENINFTVSPFGWAVTDCDKFSWNFGDGSAASTVAQPVHQYGSAGTYTVTLFVDGGVSDATITTTVKVGPTEEPIVCPTMIPGSNIYVGYSAASGCTNANGQCKKGETISFQTQTLGYNLTCATHTYTWKFGDTQQASGRNTTHAYAQEGEYNLILTVSNGKQTVNIPQKVKVTGAGIDPPVCSPMVPNSNVFIGFIGPDSGCTSSNGDCKKDEDIAFTAGVFGYNYSCATHSFAWEFGDGGTSNQQNVTHRYAQGGTYKVKLTITNAGQSVTMEKSVKVTAPIDCPQMVPNNNVYIGFLGEKSGCTSAAGSCHEDEAITLVAQTIGYAFGCSAHTFEWNFGDGYSSTLQNPVHEYQSKGEYTVTLKIKNAAQEVTLTDSVKVIATSTRRRTVRH